jgi:hypothetical protein
MAMRTLLQTEGIDLDDQLAYAVGIADAGNNLNGLMDGWGKPLGFTRFGSNLTFPVTNPAAAGAAAAKFADGVDNEGTLIHPVWYWFPTPTAPTFRGVFESQFHKIAIEPAVVPPAPPPAPAAAYYVLPVIGSAGKDGNFGTQADNIYNFQLRGE